MFAFGSDLVYLGGEEEEDCAQNDQDPQPQQLAQSHQPQFGAFQSYQTPQISQTSPFSNPTPTPTSYSSGFSGFSFSPNSPNTVTNTSNSQNPFGGSFNLSSNQVSHPPNPFTLPNAPKPNTNVISVNLGKLASSGQIATGDPVFCSSCTAVFNSLSKFEEKDDSIIWSCEFCNEKNDLMLDEEEIPKDALIDYIVEPAKEASKEESIVVFCIDISGSMCVTSEIEGKVSLRGDSSKNLANLNTEHADQYLPHENRNVTYVSRLQCVQAAISQQIQHLEQNYPSSKVAIIAFSNELHVFGGDEEVHVVGDKLDDYDSLRKIGTEYPLRLEISKSASTLTKKLYALSEGGCTALGPAVAVALGICEKCPGSKIVIATDGLANSGIGNLDDNAETAAKVYNDMGEWAKVKGVNISVIGIKGDSLNMETLGNLADKTTGEVDIVDPVNIRDNFTTIFENKLTATGVKIKLLLHKGLKFVESEDEGGEKEKEKENCLEREIGNAFEDTEITFEYACRSKEEVKKIMEEVKGNEKSEKEEKEKKEAKKFSLPFQIQINYTSLKGMKCIRAFTDTKEVTFERKKAEEKIDVGVLGMHANKTSAQMAERGKYQEAVKHNRGYMNLMNRAHRPSQAAQLNTWQTQNEAFNQQILKEEEVQEVSRQHPGGPRSGARQQHTDSFSNAVYQFKNPNYNRRNFRRHYDKKK